VLLRVIASDPMLASHPASMPDLSASSVVGNGAAKATAAPVGRIRATQGEGAMPAADTEEEATDR
jgi:hypothetical protein